MTIKFIAGLAIGAAVVHFLNTEEGKALIRRFKKDVESVEDDLTSLSEGLMEKGKSLIGQTKESTLDTVVFVIPE
jgi:hypothetical protein